MRKAKRFVIAFFLTALAVSTFFVFLMGLAQLFILGYGVLAILVMMATVCTAIGLAYAYDA